jgi:hypothetical protein
MKGRGCARVTTLVPNPALAFRQGIRICGPAPASIAIADSAPYQRTHASAFLITVDFRLRLVGRGVPHRDRIAVKQDPQDAGRCAHTGSAPLLGDDFRPGYERRISANTGSLGNKRQAYSFSSTNLHHQLL